MTSQLDQRTGASWHAFIWCDDGKKGYDPNDPAIGLQGNSLCNDYDRKFLKDKDVGKASGLKCKKLSDALTPCIGARISQDKDAKCFGKFGMCWNNCQEYAQDIIGDCKGQKKGN